MPWKRMLAYVTGEVDQSLLARVEYLIEENRVLRTDPGQPRPEDAVRRSDAGTPAGSSVHRELVPERQDLHLHGEA